MEGALSNQKELPRELFLIGLFDIYGVWSACVIKTQVSHFSDMTIIGQSDVVMEGLSIEYFITEHNSGGVAVWTVVSDGIADNRELQEYVFLTLVAYAAVNTFQISDEIFVDAIDDDALFSYFCHVYHLTTNL